MLGSVNCIERLSPVLLFSIIQLSIYSIGELQHCSAIAGTVVENNRRFFALVRMGNIPDWSMAGVPQRWEMFQTMEISRTLLAGKRIFLHNVCMVCLCTSFSLKWTYTWCWFSDELIEKFLWGYFARFLRVFRLTF